MNIAENFAFAFTLPCLCCGNLIIKVLRKIKYAEMLLMSNQWLLKRSYRFFEKCIQVKMKAKFADRFGKLFLNSTFYCYSWAHMSYVIILILKLSVYVATRVAWLCIDLEIFCHWQGFRSTIVGDVVPTE